MKRRLANVYLGGAQAGVPELPQVRSVPNAHECCFGVGKEDAEVMFIGEGPGQQEDLKGERSSGAAVSCSTS